jgi:hypothetical protein
MIEIEEIEGGFRAVDAAKNEVTIEIDDWEQGGEELEIGHEVDETITGSGTEIRLPNGGFVIESSEFDDPRMINMTERIRLDGGSHFFRLGTDINVYVRIDDSGALTAENSKRHNRIGFTTRTPFTIGLKQFADHPGDQVRIPPSIEGAAAAITTCGSRHTTETPDRSFPTERPSLLHLVVDDDAELDGVRGENPIVFRTPRSLEYLFPMGPLAFYLGAEVEVERREKPVLELGSESHEFSPGSAFGEEVASFLRRVFYLDCLVRESGPRRLGIKEFDLLEQTSLDPERLYHSSMLDRVLAYLDVAFESISSDLPAWPLATYVEPMVDHLTTLPYLLDRLSVVLPPQASPIDGMGMVERSLDDFYRSSAIGQVPHQPIEISSPTDTRTRVQGWIAEGSPINGFKFLPEAIENQRDYLESSFEPITVSVIVNDEAMDVEHTEVVEIYEDRAADLDIQLDVLSHATTDELARVFETQADFVHYIGHCDPEGLRCVDGNITADQLSRSRARTFFLNACGSYREGVELVRSGSVAGAVTFGSIIDGQAAKVGVNFARLFMLGYTIERSLYHASGHAIMNKQYATVGDGTHVLTQGDSIQPAAICVTTRPDGLFGVAQDMAPVNLAGSVFLAYTNSEPNLMGNPGETQTDRTELEELLKNTNDPIIFDNKFYWPEELLEELS